MNKKIYHAPSVLVNEVQAEAMMATSPGASDNPADTGSVLSNEELEITDIWGNE